MRDCSTCPSRLGEEQARDFFGKDFGPGVDVCATFGHVLGRPGLDASAVQKIHLAFAKECIAFGHPAPASKPEYPEARVTAPHPEVFVDLTTGQPLDPPDEAEQSQVANCSGCVNYVSSDVVRDELGWFLPLCSATGRLMLPRAQSKEPKRCGQARPLSFDTGTYDSDGVPVVIQRFQRDTTEGMALRPEYDDAFTFGAVRVGAAVTLAAHDFIEPCEYPTDRDVEPDEAADGIKAWRRIFNPDGSGRYVDLPIFDLSTFEPAEQAKVPRTGSDEHPEWYVDHGGIIYSLAVEFMELDRTPALIGPAGTGKTEALRHLAWLMQVPFVRISITRSSEVDDLCGKWKLVKAGDTSEMRWVDGRFTHAWSRVCVVCLDEPNVGPDDVFQFLRPAFDESKQLVLDAEEGTIRERNSWCFVGVAMNPAWDVKNIGANELSDADRRRLAPIAVDLPPENLERAILAQRCEGDGYTIPTETLDKIMAIAGDIRAMTDPLEGTLGISWGVAPNVGVARSTRWYDLVTAYKRTICDHLDPTMAGEILRIVEGYVA